jgi:hypothetical protein
MNGPSACEALPPPPAGRPGLAKPTLEPGEGSPLSFEEVLDEETAEPEKEPKTDLAEKPIEGVQPALFPLFPPPLLLFVQPPPPDPSAEVPLAPVSPETVENKLPPPPMPASRLPEQIAEMPPVPRKMNDGTSAAQQPSMVSTDSITEDKAATAKTTPLSIEYIDSPGFEKSVTVELPAARTARAGLESAEPVVPGLSPAGMTRRDPDFSMSEMVSVEEPRHVALRTANEIGGHVQLLRVSGQEKLEVVLRPDAGTELHLHITKVDGLIQVRARCDKGDFTMLEANWTLVQSSLAAQGIRVEQLQPSLAWDSHSQSRQGSSQRDEEQSARAEFIFEQDQPTQKPASPSSRPSPSRGWQRWA